MRFGLLAVLLLSSVVQGKEYLPKWDQLSVTWMTYSSLPITEKLAIRNGWTKKDTSTCEGGYFRGYRYILDDDPAVMLLFDSNGKIAGLQTAVRKTTVKPKILPWNEEGDLYVVTVYFTDTKSICSARKRANPGYIGDKLLFQNGSKPEQVMEIPHAKEDIQNQKEWVLGKCFYTMGEHYWYKISRDMDCTHFFPLFVMYNDNKLNAFGFVMDGNQKSSRFEHPGPFASTLTFKEETRPSCLDDPKPKRSSIHIYLQRRPYLNFC